MRVLFLIWTLLEADIAQLVSRELHEIGDCEAIAFHLRPEEFPKKFPQMIKKMEEAKMVLSSEREFPNMGPVAILRDIAPDIVVTTDDVDPAYRKYLISARFLGVTSLLIQPGIIGEHPFTWRNLGILVAVFPNIKRILEDYRQIWIALVDMRLGLLSRISHVVEDLISRFTKGSSAWGHRGCTRIAVTGDFLRDLLVSQGIPSESVVITGQPRFDSIFIPDDNRDEFISSLERGKQNKRTVLYLPDASSGHMMTSRDTYLAMTVNTIGACKQIPDALLVIKPHPDEDPSYYRSIVEKLESDALVYEGSNLHGLIRTSDVVVTGISTTGFETLMLNKTLVIISPQMGKSYFPPDFEYVPYLRAGVAYGIYREDDFLPVLKKALVEGDNGNSRSLERKAFVYRHTYLQDGRASRRAADLLVSMVREAKVAGNE